MPITLSNLLKQAGLALNLPPAVVGQGVAAKAQGALSGVQGALATDLQKFGVKVGTTFGYNPFSALSAGAGAAAAQTDLQTIAAEVTPTEWIVGLIVVAGGIWALSLLLRRK